MSQGRDRLGIPALILRNPDHNWVLRMNEKEVYNGPISTL